MVHSTVASHHGTGPKALISAVNGMMILPEAIEFAATASRRVATSDRYALRLDIAGMLPSEIPSAGPSDALWFVAVDGGRGEFCTASGARGRCGGGLLPWSIVRCCMCAAASHSRLSPASTSWTTSRT